MKPKTIIAILGVLALLAAFSSTARAGDEVAKSAMAQCIAERNALCERGDSDCMATGAAFCHAVHKNAFKVALDYTIMKYPDVVGATGKLLRTGEAKTVAVEKFAGDSLAAKAIVTEVKADGTVVEKEASISLLREPREGAKLVVVKSEAGGIIIPKTILESTYVTSEPACHSSHYFEDLLGEIIGLFDYEALVALFETISGVAIPLEAIPDYDGDGFADDLLLDVVAASFTEEEWNTIVETVADFAALLELLADLGIEDGTMVFEECIDDTPVRETDPEKAKAGAKKELVETSSEGIVGEEKPPVPDKCLVMCDYNNDLDCLDPLEPECNACNNPDNCDIYGACPNGCFDSKTASCLAPACYSPIPSIICVCLSNGNSWDCTGQKLPSVDICDNFETPEKEICTCSALDGCGGPGCSISIP